MPVTEADTEQEAFETARAQSEIQPGVGHQAESMHIQSAITVEEAKN